MKHLLKAEAGVEDKDRTANMVLVRLARGQPWKAEPTRLWDFPSLRVKLSWATVTGDLRWDYQGAVTLGFPSGKRGDS